VSEKEKEKERHHEDAEDVEELKEVLNVVSQQVPSLIKGIIASVFSAQAGEDMGKAVGAYYKGLKDAGIPEEVAVKMTEKYAATFSSLGDVIKSAVSGDMKKGKETGEAPQQGAEEKKE
jgi:hypothetical protein